LKNKNGKTAIILLLVLLSAVNIDASGIPVVDTAAITQLLMSLEEILVKYKAEIAAYKDIINIKDEYISSMREIIYRSETLFNAITYFPKTVPGQFEVNPYFYDQLKKDPWGNLFQQDGQIEDKYPEFGDYSYITENPLYGLSERYREYADNVLKMNNDEKIDMDNQFGLIKLMKEFQQERDRLLDEFKDVIVPAFGSGSDEKDEKKVVDVTKLYYAIGMAKLEVLKQKLELLLMEKEMMENYIKREVNKIRYRLLNIEYYDLDDQKEY
jgi:hypothetical protein